MIFDISKLEVILEEIKVDALEYLRITPSDFNNFNFSHLVKENSKYFNSYFGNDLLTIDNLKTFYTEHPSYMEELLSWHYYQKWNDLWTLHQYAKGKSLDFGGGIGTMSFILDFLDIPCDYYDINIKMKNFVKFRIEKRGIKNINIIDKPTGIYQCIFCIDVLEHLIDWKDILKNLIENHTALESYIVHNTHFQKTEDHPMHICSDIDVNSYLKNFNFTEIELFRVMKRI